MLVVSQNSFHFIYHHAMGLEVKNLDDLWREVFSVRLCSWSFRSLFLKNAIVFLTCTRKKKKRKKTEKIQILKPLMYIGGLCDI